MMKKLSIAILFIAVIFSCTNEKNSEKEIKKEVQDKQDKEESELKPLSNMYGEDSIDAEGNIVYAPADESKYEVNKEVVPQVDSATGKKYTLGPRPDVPFSNQYGDDSIGPDGNFVYPPVDTLWITDKE